MLQLYGVSRESLREALRLLEVQGLINIRRGPGGGPVVGTVDPANLGRVSTLYFHMAGATYRELFEAWELSESLLAERAARNANASLRRRVMAPYLEQDNLPRPDLEIGDYVHQHSLFHGDVARLANNRVLELSYQIFGQVVSHHFAAAQDPRELRERIDEDHVRLARAITAGHFASARELMADHIRLVADTAVVELGDEADDYIEWL